jgi:hypothetical protein
MYLCRVPIKLDARVSMMNPMLKIGVTTNLQLRQIREALECDRFRIDLTICRNLSRCIRSFAVHRTLPWRVATHLASTSRLTTSHSIVSTPVIILLVCFGQSVVRGEVEPLTGAVLLKKCLRVPEDHSTIQAAVNAVPDGGTVLVAPGVYHESMRIEAKSVNLVSRFLLTRDPDDIHATVLDGSTQPDPDLEDDIDPVLPAVILIADDAGPGTTILGLTIRDGDDGIACHAKVRILYNRFVNNTDAIDYENGGGECRFNHFVANDDDAVDLDEGSEALVADNEIHDNDDDGIEIRLHPYRGKPLKTVIRDNRISGNGEDGI